MSEKGLTKAELKTIEDMAAEGLEVADIAEQFGLTLVQAKKWVSENLEVHKAIKDGKDRLAMVNKDAQRRSRVEKRATWFIPTDTDLACIEELTKLGWSEVKIAQQFDIDLATWRAARNKYPEIKDAVARGQAQGNGRLILANMKTWQPTPDDLATITQMASEGFTPDVIAAKMGIAVGTLEYKMQEVPEIQAAYDMGFKKIEGEVVGALMTLVKKGNVGAIIYFLKSRNKAYWAEALPRVGEKDVSAAQPHIVNLPVPDANNPKKFESEGDRFRREHKAATQD